MKVKVEQGKEYRPPLFLGVVANGKTQVVNFIFIMPNSYPPPKHSSKTTFLTNNKKEKTKRKRKPKHLPLKYHL